MADTKDKADVIVRLCRKYGLPVPVREYAFDNRKMPDGFRTKDRKIAGRTVPGKPVSPVYTSGDRKGERKQCRAWRFDCAWPEYGVAVEVHGAAFAQGRHTRGAGMMGDSEKLRQAAAQGWRVLPVVTTELRTRPAEVMADVYDALKLTGPVPTNRPPELPSDEPPF